MNFQIISVVSLNHDVVSRIISVVSRNCTDDLKTCLHLREFGCWTWGV